MNRTVAAGGADSPGVRRRGRNLARISIASAVIVVLLAIYAAAVVIQSHQPRSLARTESSWPVGRIQLEVAVPKADVIAGPASDSVWLWYPSVENRSRPAAPYAPGHWQAMHLPGPVGQAETSFKDLRIRARENSRPGAGRFPFIVLQPGLGFSAPQYQALAEDLASAGFVVAGITPTGSANTTVINGRVVASSPEGNLPDTGTRRGKGLEAADQLLSRWSGAAVAVAAAVRQNKIISAHLRSGTVYVGHSFGGAASLQACHDDRRCLGAVDLDGAQYGSVVQTGLDHPLMLIGAADSCITGRCPAGASDNAEDRKTAASLLGNSSGPSWCGSIPGTRHFNFTDYGDYYLAFPLRKLLALGTADGDHATQTIDRAITAFARRVTTGGSGNISRACR